MNDKSLERYVVRSSCSCDVESLKEGLNLHRLSKLSFALTIAIMSVLGTMVMILGLMSPYTTTSSENHHYRFMPILIWVAVSVTGFVGSMIISGFYENFEDKKAVDDLEKTLEDFKEAFGSNAFHILNNGTSDEIQKAIELTLTCRARSIAVDLVNSPNGKSPLMRDFLKHWRLADLFASSPSYREIEKEACPDGDCCGRKLPNNWLG